LSHWLREFNSWTDLNAIVYHGTADNRQTIREFEMAYEQDRPQGGVGFNQYYLRKCGPKKFTKKDSPWMAQVVITTPEMLVSDAELFDIHWTVVVVDEAQKCKNINSKMSMQLRSNAESIDHLILLSGTPIQNNMEVSDAEHSIERCCFKTLRRKTHIFLYVSFLYYDRNYLRF
jgi:SNF2 family DNA or RNA helicase